MKKYLTAGTLGIAIGIAISIIMSLIFGDGAYLPVNPVSTMGIYYSERFTPVVVMSIAVVVWFLIGLLFQAADLCFEQEWSLLRMSATHFIVVSIGFTGLAILAGWFPLTVAGLLFFWLLYVVIYAIVYWMHYRQMKAHVESINQAIGS
ncbi:putative membrane protein [Streptococcus rupicaprae]|uniref:Membrane protein n=1 Tax=Streptococcus rupicaprae TaxID=759619 RepID=A0ABV2FJ02_9STRE